MNSVWMGADKGAFLPDAEALRKASDVLVRRVADQGAWFVGMGHSQQPTADGKPAMGHVGFGFAPVTDRAMGRTAEPDGFRHRAWWVPETSWYLSGDNVARWSAARERCEHSAHALKHGDDADAVVQRLFPRSTGSTSQAAIWHTHVPRDHYLRNVERLLGHIQRGDIYEVNYCTARTTHLPDFDPYAAFAKLLTHTNAPFAAYYRQGDHYALCMSPERYLRLQNGTVTTQPMKGTRPRGIDASSDDRLKTELHNDPKERSEHVMAVDVARNDLGRIATPGTVRVPFPFAIHTFPRVHQLVSTVQATLAPGKGLWDVVRSSFPMASMTGAPKRKALQLIAEVETEPRGLYSGALGFQLPNGDADLNVVIRTITYDARTGMARLMTGGAITAQSDPEREWEECEVKALSVLRGL